MSSQPELFALPSPAMPVTAWPSSHLRVSRVGEAPPAETVDQPTLAAAYWFRHIAALPIFDAAKEHLAIILLNTKNRTIGWNLVSIGSLNESVAHPREIFRPAIAVAASAFILMHNHPSGESSPSDPDRRLTTRIEEAARLLQIRFLDHVIVGASPADRLFSFREAGII